MQNDKIKLTEKQEKTILEFLDYKKKIKEMQDKLKECNKEVLAILSGDRFTNVKLDFGNATICKKEGHTRVTIDGDKLRELNPNIALECEKETFVSESLSVTFK